MCGIFGWSIPKNANIAPEQRVLLTRALFALNDARGGDSWGLAVLNGSLNISRGLGEAWKTAAYKDYHLEEADVVFGHTRKATTGDKTIPNSHPFEIASDKDPSSVIIGAHNGMICDHEKLNAKYGRKYEVDSMHIFGHIANGLPTNELAGYGACEFTYKDNPEIIRLFKFNSGELSVAGLPDPTDDKSSRGVIWSSSFMHLESALRIAGLDGFFNFAYLETEKIYEVMKGKLFNTKNPQVFGPGNSYNYSSGSSYSGHHSDYRGHFSGGVPSRSATDADEEDIADYIGEGGGQTRVWGNRTMSDTEYEIWNSDNYIIKRMKGSTTLMRVSSETPLTTSAPKLENEPTAPDEAKDASMAIVAELSAA